MVSAAERTGERGEAQGGRRGERPAEHREGRPRGERRRGFTLQWHITDRCNLRCLHCYREDEAAADLGVLEASRLLRQLFDAMDDMHVAAHVAFTGGEPLTRPELLFALLEEAAARHRERPTFSVGLMTNATLIDDEAAQRLAAYCPMLSSVQVSLDGSTAAQNDSIRGRGAFARTVAGIAALRRACPAALTISFTVQRQNLDDLGGIVDLGAEMGVDSLHIARFAPLGRGKDLRADAENPLTREDVRRAIEFLYQRNEEARAAIARGDKRPLVAEERTLFHLADPAEAIRRYSAGSGRRLGNACAIGVATATVQSDGTLLPCRRLPIPLGNLTVTPFLTLWGKSEVLWDFRLRQRRLAGKCRACEFFTRYPGLCSGGAACVAYAALGDYNLPDPHCWYEPGAGAGTVTRGRAPASFMMAQRPT